MCRTHRSIGRLCSQLHLASPIRQDRPEEDPSIRAAGAQPAVSLLRSQPDVRADGHSAIPQRLTALEQRRKQAAVACNVVVFFSELLTGMI